MQPMQPPPGKAGLFAMPPCGKELRKLVLRRPVCYAVNLSRAALANIYGPVCYAANMERSAAVNRCQLATMRAGLFRMQSRRRRWRGLHPVNTALPSMARHDHAATGTCSPGRLCKFAQNRAVQALRNRPISTTRDTLQELHAAISNGLAAFQSTAGNAAQCSPDRPPGVDTLRICAVGVKFS